jgi:DNA-binding IclR family transcriptional regulator
MASAIHEQEPPSARARKPLSGARPRSRHDGVKRAAPGAADRARAAVRAFEVLEFFREHGQPARTAEIGRALGIPNSSADDLLKVLHATGYLSFNPCSKYYSPSYRVIRLAEEFMAGFPALSQVHEIERSILDETGQTVMVAAQEGAMLRVVSVLKGRCPELLMRIGCLQPLAHYEETQGWILTSTFAGALLAANSDLEIINILRELDAPGRHTDFNPLLERVRRIRKRGVADCEVIRAPAIAACASWLGRSKEMPALAIGCIGYAGELAHWRPYFDRAVGNIRHRWASAR